MSQQPTHRKYVFNSRYYFVAEAAAMAERSGDYEQAAELWLEAVTLAKRPVNEEWSEHRSQYCLSILRNGWSQKQS